MFKNNYNRSTCKTENILLYLVLLEPADSRDILNKSAENLAVALDGQGKIKDPIGLITCWDDVAQLLVNCRIMPIGINELVPLESVLPSNFWDSGKEADLPPSLLQELDF